MTSKNQIDLYLINFHRQKQKGQAERPKEFIRQKVFQDGEMKKTAIRPIPFRFFFQRRKAKKKIITYIKSKSM